MGIQNAETLDGLLDGIYIYWCTSSMMDNNKKKGKTKDSTINENNLKYKYKH